MRNNAVIRALGIIFFSLLATYFSSSTAHAAPTTVTGTISNIPADAYVWATGEKKVGDNWVRIESAYDKEIQNTGVYNLSLGEVAGSQIRVWIRIESPSGGYLLGGDATTVSSTSITKNYSSGIINIKLQANNASYCINGSVGANFVNSTAGPAEDPQAPSATFSSTGIANLSLPAGYDFNFTIYCGGSENPQVSATTTSVLQTIPVTVPIPNLVGTVSGISSTNDVWGCIEKLVSAGSNSRYECQYGMSVNNSGLFGVKIPQGTYRISLVPSETANSDLVNTYSEVFTVSSTQVTVNFAMSTTANFVYTITPSSAAKDGWVNVNTICTIEMKKNGEGCYGINLGRNIPSSGIVKFNLDPGSYKISAYPGSNPGNYVYATSPEVTITGSGAVLTGTLALNLANLKFVVAPAGNAQWGYITMTNQSTETTYYCSIDESANCNLYAPAGTYRVEINPGNPSSTALFTVISNLVVTGSTQVENVTLSGANVTGTVSSTTVSAGGYIQIQERKTEGVNQYWQYFPNATPIDVGGNFALALPEGTYRLLARCSSDNCKDFLPSPSNVFTVSSGNTIVNITLRTANISGTVSELVNAVGGYVYVAESNLNLSKDDYFGLDFSSRINSDGTYQMYLPDGKYKFRAESTSEDYIGIVSDLTSISSTPTTLNLSIVLKNISGTVYPVAKSKGSYGCIEQLVSGVWNGGDCFSISDTGTYKIYLPAGTYRANVYPNKTATGVYNITSDPFTVTTGAQTFNFTLPTNNLSVAITPSADAINAFVSILKYIDNEKYVTVNKLNVNSSGNIEAYLPPGRYKLEIYPNSFAYDVTRSSVFDIPSSSEFPVPTSIALVASNITGTITPLDYAKWASVCLLEKNNGSSDGKTIWCTSSGELGKYKFNAPNGTYKVIVYPQRIYSNGNYVESPYVITTSNEFTIANDTKTVDITLSTGNLSGTITDVAKSAGGWVYVLKVDGAYPEGTPYSKQISSSGKYAFQLPSGK
jgi:hypothetical protein